MSVYINGFHSTDIGPSLGQLSLQPNRSVNVTSQMVIINSNFFR